MMQSLARSGAPSLAVAVLLVISLAGCSSASATQVSLPTTAPVEADSAETDPTSPASEPRLSEVDSGTLIAEGDFKSDGAAGRIEIRANGAAHGFDVTLIGMEPPPPMGASIELNALPATASEDEFRSGFSYYRYEKLQTTAEQTFTSPPPGYGGFESPDPRYMRTAVIWVADEGSPVGFGWVFATAPLTWHLPGTVAVPDVVDNGESEGARGEVILAADGSLGGYRVAAGDTPDGLTTRFGISLHDLEWLNVDRMKTRLLLAGITLNLSPSTRGLRW